MQKNQKPSGKAAKMAKAENAVCDESKTHLYLSLFFNYISALKVLFNVKL